MIHQNLSSRQAASATVLASLNAPSDLWSAWSAYFDNNLTGDRLQLDNPPHTLPDTVRRALAASLAVFQLGESGDGSTLRRFAQRVASDRRFSGYEAALTKFLAEENRHARTLSGLVKRLDGELLERQWTQAIFKKLRRLLNLEFELQILMTAEFVAEAYYAILRDRAEDPVVCRACERILRDEISHLRFHGDFFATRQQTWPPILRGLWSVQCRMIFFVTARVVWLDHRPCFRALGVSYPKYRGLCKRSIDAFMRRIDRQRRQLATAASQPNGNAILGARPARRRFGFGGAPPL